MARAFKCDMCKNFFEQDNGHDNRLKISLRYSEATIKWSRDICAECEQKIASFFEDESKSQEKQTL